jgi:hypothetical protein
VRFEQPASTTGAPLSDSRQQLAVFALERGVPVDMSGSRVHVTQARFVEHVDARDITVGQIVGIACAATASNGTTPCSIAWTKQSGGTTTKTKRPTR